MSSSRISPSLKLPRAVLFDNDGVLVQSEPLHWKAWKSLIEGLGIPYEEGEIRSQVGKTGPQIISSILNRHRPGWSPDEFPPDALALRKNDFYLTLTETLKPFPGVKEGLEWLRARGVRIAAVSNAKRRELTTALQASGLEPYFDVMISRDDSPVPKPDPSPYLIAAANLGIEPEDCIGVEDSPPGIEAVLMAKIPAAAVLTNFKRETMESPVPGRPDLKPAWVGDTPADFFEWLKALPGR